MDPVLLRSADHLRMNADEDRTVADRLPDPFRLPQPGWRLLGFASIGLGTGLFSAEVPFVVLGAALVPALIALLVIATQATAGPQIAEHATRAVDEVAHSEVAHRR
jgi:hypothetical protein